MDKEAVDKMFENIDKLRENYQQPRKNEDKISIRNLDEVINSFKK